MVENVLPFGHVYVLFKAMQAIYKKAHQFFFTRTISQYKYCCLGHLQLHLLVLLDELANNAKSLQSERSALKGSQQIKVNRMVLICLIWSCLSHDANFSANRSNHFSQQNRKDNDYYKPSPHLSFHQQAWGPCAQNSDKRIVVNRCKLHH